ncbi:hypothetical protein DF185_18630 [Marinifilum breve]|uniref:Uncharacterized protein n=1 Tax=Marinifilum breve TaxID=2184082 RepID=A0A2V3ZS62_9BACT|nr:hypothetical protein [Marinifilum breve]PXX97041.1 hypothetical protein DF185_18630 [Marinifilum breve]
MGNFSEQIKRNEENYDEDYFDPDNIRNQLSKKSKKRELSTWLIIRIIMFICFAGYILYTINQI